MRTLETRSGSVEGRCALLRIDRRTCSGLSIKVPLRVRRWKGHPMRGSTRGGGGGEVHLLDLSEKFIARTCTAARVLGDGDDREEGHETPPANSG
jgi:hypothetical protein